MRIDLSKTSHVLFFVVFLPGLSFSIGWAFAQIIPSSAPFWVETVSPLGAYALLYSFFEHVAWHWPFFTWVGIVEAPDLRGRWVGEQLSSFKTADGKPTRSRVVVEIEQSFSQVEAKAYYHRWSDGHRASCFLKIDGQLYLMGIFESDPNARHDGHEQAHKGVLRLQYLKEEDALTGNYFNSFGNHGELRLTRTGRDLYYRFSKEPSAK